MSDNEFLYQREQRLEVEQEWEQEVRNSEKGLRYKAASSGQRTKPWFSKIKFDGRKFITICRLRFHHNHLNGHLYRLKMVKPPNCDCGVEEDANHVFFGCERREAQTTELHLDLMNIGQQPPFNEDIRVLRLLNKLQNANGTSYPARTTTAF
ncbi:hypothetical protein QE152_g7082 [Popillia japonica]|uniref:Reverse transcriptase n=1 Tax=Popillia japonica TaxID=7064 RepID=A0AAW1MF58_POPJA